MKKLLIILLFYFLYNCSNNEQLTDNIKTVLLNYQKAYPYPNEINNINGKSYIYTATFFKNKDDTLVSLYRSTYGIMPELKGYGIYKDTDLKETFIYDENNLSKKFIKIKIHNTDKKKYIDLKGSFDESFPPIHTYLVRNKELYLIKIDTIWKHWQ